MNRYEEGKGNDFAKLSYGQDPIITYDFSVLSFFTNHTHVILLLNFSSASNNLCKYRIFISRSQTLKNTISITNKNAHTIT